MQGSAVGQGIIKRKRIKLNNLSQCLSLSGRYDIPAQHNSLVVLGGVWWESQMEIPTAARATLHTQ